MPLSSEVTGVQAHAVDAQSNKQSGGAPRSFSKLHSTNYPVRATGDSKSALGTITLKRAELVHGATTGDSTKFDRSFVGFGTAEAGLEHRVRPKTELEVTMEAKTVEKMYTFLTTYATGLAKMAEDPPPQGAPASVNNMLEFVLLDPDKRGDKLFADALLEKGVDRDGKTFTQLVNAEKIKDFLQTSDGWAEAIMAGEQYGLWAKMGLGVTADINHKMFHRQLNNNIDQRRQIILEEDIKTVRGHLKSGTSTVLAAAGAGYAYLFSSGKRELDFTPNLTILAAMKLNASPVDRAYLKHMIGVDIDKIDLVPTGGGYTVRYAEGYSPNVQTTLAAVGDLNKARGEVLRTLGVEERPTSFRGRTIDRGREIRFMEEFIEDPSKRPEALPLRYSMKIMDEYDKLLTSAVAAGPVTQFDRLRFMAKAREKIRVEYGERRVKFEQVKREVGEQDALIVKRNQMVNNREAYRKDRKDEGEKKIVEATKSKGEAEAKKKELTEGPAALSMKDRAVTNLERDMVRDFGLDTSVTMDKAVEAMRTTLKKALKDAEDKYDDVLKEQVKEVKDYNDTLLTKIPVGGYPKGTVPPDFTALAASATRVIEARFAPRIASTGKLAAQAEARLDELEGQFKAYGKAVSERDTATVELSSREPRQIIDTYDAFDMFVAGGLATQKEVQDFPVDKLAALLIAVPEEERVDLVLRAKAVDVVDRAFTLPQYQTDAINTLLSAGLDPDDIVSRDRGELAKLVDAYYVALGTPKAADEIREEVEAAYAGMGRNLRALAEARLTQEITYYDTTAKAEQKKIDKLGEFKEPIADLDAIISVMDAQLETYSRVYELTDNNADMMRFVDTTLIKDTDKDYSEAERKQAKQKGISAWYGLLNEEFTTSSNRDGRFDALFRVVPPEKLAELLDENLLYMVPPSNDVDLVFGNIETEINNGTLTGPRMQQAVKAIVTYMKKYGLAL